MTRPLIRRPSSTVQCLCKKDDVLLTDPSAGGTVTHPVSERLYKRRPILGFTSHRPKADFSFLRFDPPHPLIYTNIPETPRGQKKTSYFPHIFDGKKSHFLHRGWKPDFPGKSWGSCGIFGIWICGFQKSRKKHVDLIGFLETGNWIWSWVRIPSPLKSDWSYAIW